MAKTKASGKKKKSAVKSRARGKKTLKAKKSNKRKIGESKAKKSMLHGNAEGASRSRRKTTSTHSARGTSASRLRGGTSARRTTEINSGSTRQGPRGVGPDSGGQSGDLQGLSRAHDVDSESVEELVEEGQGLEAGLISGVERADADNAEDSEVTTEEPPEEKIPKYRNRKSL